MPTGYTADIYEGKNPSFRVFVLKCARAMGVAVTMRDDSLDVPLPEHFEPDRWHEKRLGEAGQRLAELVAMPVEECERRARTAHEAALSSLEQRRADYQRMTTDYDAMIAQVEAWEPPELLAGLKKFMLDQLREARTFDCYDPDNPDSLKFYSCLEPVTAEVWRANEIASTARVVQISAEEWAKEQQRTNERNEYLDALFASLPDPVATGVVRHE